MRGRSTGDRRSSTPAPGRRSTGRPGGPLRHLATAGGPAALPRAVVRGRARPAALRAPVDGRPEPSLLGVMEQLALAVSELGGNALRHARAPVTVSLARRRHGWLLNVSDGDPGSPPMVTRPASCAGTGTACRSCRSSRPTSAGTSRPSSSTSGRASRTPRRPGSPTSCTADAVTARQRRRGDRQTSRRAIGRKITA